MTRSIHLQNAEIQYICAYKNRGKESLKGCRPNYSLKKPKNTFLLKPNHNSFFLISENDNGISNAS